MIFRRLAGCLLILAVAALSGFGQSRSNNTARNAFTIAGNIRDDAGQRTMENVRVDLKLSTGIPINTTFTRGNGEFEFGGLSNGDYVIEVNLKDYEPYRQTVSLNGGSQRGISIFMARPIAMGHSNTQGSVSAHELSVPNKAHEEYEKGLQLLYEKGDERGAIVQFQRAIKDFSTFYEAYAQEGNAYLRLKDPVSAEQSMRKSIELSSGQYPVASLMLAGLLNDTQRYEDAATFAEQGVETDPASWRGPFELARSFSGRKQFEQAEKAASEARDLKPDNPPIYLMLANIHIQRRDYPALSKDLSAYLKLVPTGPDADQARKTRDDLQAAMQQAENQNQTEGRRTSQLNAQDARNGDAAIDADEKKIPPPGPDSSGLPTLPPPSGDDQ